MTCCVRIPIQSLAGLAEARCAVGIDVIQDGEHCWLKWHAGSDWLVRWIMPLPGVELFERRDNQWYPFGSRFPCPGPPEQAAILRLDQVIFPAPFAVADSASNQVTPVRIQLVRDGQPRQATALRCTFEAMIGWVEQSTRRQIESLRGGKCGNEILIVGERIPLLPDARRYWGKRILRPLGYRSEPAVPESALLEVLGLQNGEVALVEAEGVEVIATAVLGTLTRARVRAGRLRFE